MSEQATVEKAEPVWETRRMRMPRYVWELLCRQWPDEADEPPSRRHGMNLELCWAMFLELSQKKDLEKYQRFHVWHAEQIVRMERGEKPLKPGEAEAPPEVVRETRAEHLRRFLERADRRAGTADALLFEPLMQELKPEESDRIKRSIVRLVREDAERYFPGEHVPTLRLVDNGETEGATGAVE